MKKSKYKARQRYNKDLEKSIKVWRGVKKIRAFINKGIDNLSISQTEEEKS